MKRSMPLLLLGAGAALCLAAGLLFPRDFALLSLLSQPFRAIGAGLRQLSLSGGAGNGIAVALYVLFCLLPLAFCLFLHRKGRGCRADLLLCTLSPLLFIACYLFINPALLPLAHLPGMGGMLLGGCIYSLLLAWGLIRCVMLFRSADEKQMLKYLRVLMYLLAAVLVIAVFFLGFTGFLEKIRGLQAGNTGANDLGLSYFFLFLQYAVDHLPQLLEIFILLAAVSLFRAMEKNRYGQEALLSAQKVSRLCALSLVITLLSHAALSLLQLLLAQHLYQMDLTLHFPLSDLMLLLLSLFLSQLLVDGKKLREDNELFI